jgi:hypothetical protein
MERERHMNSGKPGRPAAPSLSRPWDGPTLIRQCALSFDPGDKLNGSLYVCDPAGGARAAQVDAAIAQLRAAGLWSEQPVKQVQAEQKPAYEAQMQFVEAWSVMADGGELVIARFNHPKFPSSAARFDAWKTALGAATPYQDLAVKAVAYSKAFHADRDRCVAFANQLATELQAFLGVPPGKLGFAVLDAQLKPTVRSVPLGETPPGQYGQFGSWFFALRLRLEVPGDPACSEAILKFGVNAAEGRFSVDFERDFEIDPAKPDAFGPLLAEIHKELLDDYARSPDQPPKHIGFLE